MRETSSEGRPSTAAEDTAALWGRVVRNWQRELADRNLAARKA